jgi:hypothetical protein
MTTLNSRADCAYIATDHDSTIAFAKGLDIRFGFTIDAGNRAARTLKTSQLTDCIPGRRCQVTATIFELQTVIASDTGGRLIWAHETDDYRHRPGTIYT